MKEVVCYSSKPELVSLLDGSDLDVNVELAEGGNWEYPEKIPWRQIEINKYRSMYGAQDSIPDGRCGRARLMTTMPT